MFDAPVRYVEETPLPSRLVVAGNGVPILFKRILIAMVALRMLDLSDIDEIPEYSWRAALFFFLLFSCGQLSARVYDTGV